MSLVSSKLNAIYERLLKNENVVIHMKVKKNISAKAKAKAKAKKPKQTTEENKKIAEMKKILKAEENERKIIKRLLAIRD
jgi:precorrin-2 methylase